MKIGVLALQGAVREHIHQIKSLGCEAIEVKSLNDLSGLNGLVLPGGESTAMRKLLTRFQLLNPIRSLAQLGLPMFGTCAGLILLAKEIVGYDEAHLGLMDVVIERNSFGRQVDSFEVEMSVKHVGDNIPGVFIRAPHIVSVGPGVDVLAEYNGRIVLAKEGQYLGCSFHPELTEDTRLMQYFIEMVRDFNKTSLAKSHSI
ncbi:pyridoxal 5'-phosphate synthase glutaminase subunit PdxT [Lysinibacillus sp. SGAir0095]|uniref:pyridoxal 5'-phosphate synthase glutaminase subunit PdxT n=1 Tax=Lysinibacillus sp. SGAir0095 TaxID=2070463 RepID=UPI0010CCCE83|nr:pyridoxal 5'-phosphate synthase glutaminase subunit PdxT [Lysinibacillus sp. SGAir0095]QCR30703.1 pyridoxal 5'-phosphate synthase glutaminase subunit PdxT [Lysinibacillus sp. SGAir0095]